MAVIDEVHEIVWRAKSACGGEIASGLITPASIERVLGDRHELQVRIAHLLAIFDQHVSQFAVAEINSIRLRGATPRAEMDFINRDRLFRPIGCLATLSPFDIVPLKVTEIVNNRRRLRSHLAGECVRVRLFDHVSLRSADSVLVCRSVCDPLNKACPDSGTTTVEPEFAMFPMRLIAEDRDFASIWCPNCESSSVHAIDAIEMSSEVAIHGCLASVRHWNRRHSRFQWSANVSSRRILPPRNSRFATSQASVKALVHESVPLVSFQGSGAVLPRGRNPLRRLVVSSSAICRAVCLRQLCEDS